jgi:O-antigen/teichoic acid export membrane protein
MLGIPGAAVALAAWLRLRRLTPAAPAAPLRPAWEDVVTFVRMSGVVLVTGVVATGIQFVLGRLVASRFGLAQSGQYWVAWTLSVSYVTIVLGVYGTAYMPALSALHEREARQDLMRDYLRLTLLAMPLVVSAVILLKPLVVQVMFSDDLLPSLVIMRWMLLSDLFKGIAWVLSFPMLAFRDMRWFLWTELGFSGLGAVLAWLCLTTGQPVESLGVVLLVVNAAYLAAMVGYVRLRHGLRWGRAEVLRLARGVLLVAGTSALTWSELRLEVRSALEVAALVAAFLGAEALALRGGRPRAPGVAT